MDNVPCLDVDAIDGYSSCSGATPATVLVTGENEYVIREENTELDISPELKSTHSEQQENLEKDNYEPRNMCPELELRDTCTEAYSPVNRQLKCAPSNSPSNESVDLPSDANESMSEGSPSSPASESEDDGSLNANMSDHCFDTINMDNIDRTIVICSDYVLYQDTYYTGALVTFSPSGIKIEGSTVSDQGTFMFERGIDDIITIDCQWFRRGGHVTFNLKVLSEAESSCGTSAVEGLKLAVIDNGWSEKQEAITSLNEKYLAIWNIVLDPLAGMDGDDSPLQKSYFPNFDEPFEEVIYPKGDIDAVSISKRDVDLLQPETFINDTIIDFYIKYLKNQIQPEESQRFHFFNSFFFRKLADLDKDPTSISDGRAAFLRVRKWTRKLDIFGKDYIFVPVNFNLHWSLIVICHPGEVASFEDEDLDKSPKVPCILHMDSIKGNHAGLKNLVQSYLWEEWKERHKETSEDLCSKFLNLRFVSLELPQQENSFDCGLFLLHYLELFLAEAPPNFSPFKITKFSNFLNLSWFPPIEASLKRTLIQKLIFELLEIRSREISSSDCSNENHLSISPEKIENENGVELISESFNSGVTCHGNLDSQAGRGIEMTLLASSSMRNVESLNDSGMVLREFFEPGVTTVCLHGQYQSFDRQRSYYDMNGAMSPREQEDVETGEHFAYLTSGGIGFSQFTGITSQACEASYSSRGFVTCNSWNPGNSMQGEHEVGSSVETTCSSDNDDDDDDDDDVGIIGHNPIKDNVDQTENLDADQEQSPSVETVERLKNGIMLASIEVPETSITDVSGASKDTDKICDSTDDPCLTSKDNLPVLVHQNRSPAVNQFDPDLELVDKNAEMVENKGNRSDDVQMVGDVLPSEDNSTVFSQETTSIVLNQFDRDSELVEHKEARGNAVEEDAQMISDDLPSDENSTVLPLQNPGMVVDHAAQDPEVVENKDAFGDTAQTLNDESSAELARQPAAKKMRLTPVEEVVDS